MARLSKGEFVLDRRTAAHLYVALTSAQDKQGQVAAALARKALQSLADQYTEQIAAYWEAANRDALGLLLNVAKNNPGKDADQIAKRPDIQAALRQPYEIAAQKSEALLRAAWEKASEVTSKQVKSELKLIGGAWKGSEPDESMLESLVGDLHANAKAVRDRYLYALGQKDGFSAKAKGVANDSVRRARYSASVAVWGSSTATRDDAFAKAGVNKMWLSRMDEKTCTHCKTLHGTVVGPKEPFPVNKSLKVYGDKLWGPPRHPNCRCVIVGTKFKKTKIS